MAKKGGVPDVTKLTAKDLETIARTIRRYAEEYDAAAKEMREHQIESVNATGIKSLHSNALKLIRGNASALKTSVQKMVDMEVIGMVLGQGLETEPDGAEVVEALESEKQKARKTLKKRTRKRGN
jgi:hypothetical protein